jgi:Domain of unknown function (DUF1707)
MANGYNVRVGDADREAVAAQLRDHFADGRLTHEELNERLDQAFAAKTKADLNTVMRDLPQAARPAAGMPYGGTAWQGPAWPGPMATRPGYGHGSDYGCGGGQEGQRPRGFSFAPMIALVWLFVILGAVFLFGGIGGGGRPLAIVLFLAALALVRRLIGMGRRRGSTGPRGPRGRRRW